MANYVPSNLVLGQGHLTSSFAKGEMRFRDPVGFKSLMRGSEIATPGYKDLRTREDRNMELDFFVRTSRALGVGRSHTHTGAKGDTAVITPAFSTSNDVFATSLKQANKNNRTLQEMYNNELMNSVINFTEQEEDAAANFIFNNRNAFDHGVNLEGTFNAANQTFEITEATHGERAIQITQSRFDILKYQGVMLDVYCDTVAYNKFKFQRAQGQGNSTNLEFQFTDGSLTFYHMPDMNAETQPLYTKGFWAVIPTGMAAVLDWIPTPNLQGISSTVIGGVAEYGSIINPITGMTHAIHKIWKGADETARNGYTQDVIEDVEISIDLAFEVAPLSNATETPILAFALV